MADALTPEQQAAADKAAAAAADKAAAAQWKDKSYAELAAEHVRLHTSGLLDEATAFHSKFIKTFKDK